jgi:hypothetical protein
MNRWSLLTVIFAIILSTSLANAAISISACGVKLTTSGAYVVTANLTNPSNATPCITVNTEYVNIDLNGFTLTGRGGDFGIRLNAAYLTVSNGQLIKFGFAVDGPLKGVSTFQNNSADSNSVDAFHSGEGDSTFTNNTATNSVTGFGFNLACPSNLIGNTAQQNQWQLQCLERFGL